MKRAIIQYDEPAEGADPLIKVNIKAFLVEIPVGAAVTITENCSQCIQCLHNNPRKSPVCLHPKAQATRPYADDLDGRDRHVTLDSRPTWCPL